MPTDSNREGSILIIGATGGIGEALTRALAASGAQLVLAARREEPLRRLAAEVGGKAIAGDATSFEQVASFVAEAGRLSGAVNLCGSILLKPAHLTTEADFAETIALNLTSSFALLRAAAPIMRRQGGSIVLMSSAAASIGLANHEAIAAAKAGVEGLVRAGAATYASQNIRLNCIAPGLVDTPLAQSITANEAVLKASTAMHPLQRIGRPSEIASIIKWLLGPEAGWVTGQTLGIDGGLARVRSRGG